MYFLQHYGLPAVWFQLLEKGGGSVADNFLLIGLGDAVWVDEHVAIAGLPLLGALSDGYSSA